MGEYLFTASAIFSIANGAVLLWVNPRRPINRIFFGSAVWIALWLMCVALAIRTGQGPYTTETVVFWIRASSVIAAFSIWLIWLMKSVLQKEHLLLAPIVSASWPWFLASSALAALTFSESFIQPSSSTVSKGRGFAYFVYATGLILFCAVLFVDALHRMRQLRGVRRTEMQFFVIGTICACLMVVVSNGLGLLLDSAWLRRASSIWFSMLHGITVWAVCYHRVFDAKQVILSIGQRTLLLIFASSATLMLYNFSSQFIKPPWSLFLATTAACISAVSLDRPFRRWAGLDFDRQSATPRRQIIEWAREVSDEDRLKENFQGLLRDFCQTNSVVFFSLHTPEDAESDDALPNDWAGFSLVCKDGWSTPETLQRSRTAIGTNECEELMRRRKLGALLAVPKGSNQPSLVVGLGQKESLRPYTFPDIEVLIGLAELMDNILTHSRVASHAAHIKRMAAVSMISRGLAHDLNSLATPISTFLVHMEEKVTPGATDALVLKQAKASLKVMQDYIRESLFFSGSLTPHFVRIEARRLFDAITDLSQDRSLAVNVRLTVHEPADFFFIGDLALLRRLLQNLVFNAIDASQDGGSVDLSVNIVDGDHVCLQVADTGSGIPPEIRSRIFEPYFTTKNSPSERRGLGLGLTICQKITEVHGGSIAVCSNSPQGTIFTAMIPLQTTVPCAPFDIHNAELPFMSHKPRASLPNFGPTQSINGAPS